MCVGVGGHHGAAAAAVPRISSVGALAGAAAVLALDVGTPVWVPDVHGPANGKKPGCVQAAAPE